MDTAVSQYTGFIIPSLNELVDSTLTRSLTLFESFAKILTEEEERKKEDLLKHLNDFNRIISKQEINDISVQIVKKLPKRKLDIEDFGPIFKDVITLIGNKGKLKDFETYIKTKFGTKTMFGDFLHLFLENVSIQVKEQTPQWIDYLVEEEKLEYLSIFNEVIQTLEKLDKVAIEIKNFSVRKSIYGLVLILLNFLRISQILMAYKEQDYKLALELSKYLRMERRELSSVI